VAVLLGLPSSVLLLQFFLEDVAVHLAHPYDRKLPKASSVSLDRPFMYLVAYRRCVGRGSPLLHVFLGGPSKWHQPLPAGVWLHTLLSFPPFLGVFSGPVCLFQCQALERWIEPLPSRVCEGRGRLRLTQNAFFFSCMRLCVFWMLQPSIAAFLCCF
jgi:hypothetical protein